MISTKEDRDLRIKLLEVTGWNIAKAAELEFWITWGCTPEQMDAAEPPPTPNDKVKG